MASSEVAVSLANFEGLIKGTSAPQFLPTEAISSSSVERTIRSNIPLLSPASIDQAINGLSKNSFMFFLGILLDPPRARINPKKFFMFSILYYSQTVCLNLHSLFGNFSQR